MFMQSFFKKIDDFPCSIQLLQKVFTAVAALITIRVIYIQHGVINADSVLYYEAARLFASGQLQEGFAVFNWPFYSVCIAFVNKVTSLSIENSASTLNVIFFIITAFSFLKIIELTGGKEREVIAGCLILLASKYIVGITLAMHIRDQGFWAFFLTALIFFIRFYKNGNLKDAVLWQVYILVATLFRLEGLSFLLALPLCLFFLNDNSIKAKSLDFLKSNFINISLLLGICFTALASQIISIKDFGRLHEVFGLNAYNEFTAQLFDRSKMLNAQILGRYLEKYATEGLVLTTLYASIAETVRSTGGIVLILATAAFFTKADTLDQKVSKIILFAAIISLINFALITTKTFVIANRYVFPFTFCAMIFAAFYLAHVCHSLLNKKNLLKIGLGLVIVLMLLGQLIDNLSTKDKGYFYQQDAVSWLKKNNPANKSIFYDESKLRYYANEPFIGKFDRNSRITETYINNKSINSNEILVINYHAEIDKEYIKNIENALPQYREVKRFYSKNKKSYVAIYYLNAP